jgi:hypothetical protein
MEHSIANLISLQASPSSPESQSPRPVPRKLVSFFDSYRIDAPGWNPAEQAFASKCQQRAIEFAMDMRNHEPGRFLSLLGQTSAGKTMLARLLLRFWNRGLARPHARLLDWPSHDWREVEAERDTPMLAIDEIGRGTRGGNGPEWTRLMDLLNHRQSRRLWTVLTSNLTYPEIQRQDPAIASRLRRNEGIVLQAGADVRPFEERI